MRAVRILLFAFLLAGAFYFFTTARPGPYSPSRWLAKPGHIELTEAAESDQKLDPEEQINVNVYKKAIPAVVNIRSRSVAFNFFYGVVPEEGEGTGFILDKQGHIMTNYHVIANARQIEVTLYNRKTYRAELVGPDPNHDLAIIQIHADNLTPATIGDSRGLQVGQKVFAIGNPFGLNGTMTRGIVSSIRSVQEPSGNVIDEAIQTDAAINPGNSGGPLLNSRGEVVGVNTMIVGQQSAGIGFAIPINTAKAVVGDLEQYGRVRRPALGFTTLPIGPELSEQMGLAADYGLLVIQVVPGGPADRAGIRGGSEPAYLGDQKIMLGGDLIVAIDGNPVQDQRDLNQVMNSHRAGDKITVTLFRGKRKLEVTVALGEATERV